VILLAPFESQLGRAVEEYRPGFLVSVGLERLMCVDEHAAGRRDCISREADAGRRGEFEPIIGVGFFDFIRPTPDRTGSSSTRYAGRAPPAGGHRCVPWGVVGRFLLSAFVKVRRREMPVVILARSAV
jgi:hypothetical protein